MHFTAKKEKTESPTVILGSIIDFPPLAAETHPRIPLVQYLPKENVGGAQNC